MAESPQTTAKVRLEVLPWLSNIFGSSGSRRLVMEEQVAEGETVRHLLNRLAERYQGFQETVFDPKSQKLSGQVTVVFNDRLLELLQGLDTEIEDGDTIIMLPAFVGG